ncbi:MAG: hypothetical protein HN919_03555 [Verrucomicrobia bacterium]|jgi:hypothetical protein|nr:hypothetical protein [Verrucomicrobiota bacterium]MBT7065355.1 hypothetical protein [Verrucomicrobiota bacterium]MBT7701977.1 hypothetical protein [Verrucomicrobiota bacterium]
MKRLIASLLVLGGVALFVSGCKTKEEAPAVPKAEVPAAPKDHPAH